MSAPASRPVHPCVTSITKQGSRGVEFSCWAYLTHTRQIALERQWLPNLVTAAASTIRVFTPNPINGKLKLEYVYPNIAGSIVFLSTLSAKSDHEPDALLIGFGGHARLSVVTIDSLHTASTSSDSSTPQATMNPHLLQAICLLDFTSVWNEFSCGATSQEDAIFTMLEPSSGSSKNRAAAVAVVLGGGVAVAVTEIVAELLPNDVDKKHGWFAREPYILPLLSMSSQLPHVRRATNSEYDSQQHQAGQISSNNNESSSMVTGWGDILDAAFLSAYSTAETLVLLHSAPGGTTWVGRLARENTLGPPPLYLTALCISVPHARTALLWSFPMTSDARTLHPLQNGTGCLVMGTNTIVSVEAGRIQQILAVNGFARSTCPATLADQLLPNPIGLKLALQLDGSVCCFLNNNTALVILRRCQVYILQRATTGRWSMLPTGQTLATMGEVAHLQSFPLFNTDSNSSSNRSISSLLTSIARQGEPRLDDDKNKRKLTMGLVIAGSRLGDSHILGYAVDKINVPVASVIGRNVDGDSEMVDQEIPLAQNQVDNIPSPNYQSNSSGNGELSDPDRILEIEEEALYAPLPPTTTKTAPNIVQPSDDDDDYDDPEILGLQTKRRRPNTTKLSVLRCLEPLDRLFNLGPVGPSCEGPLAAPPMYLNRLLADQPIIPSSSAKESIFGASAFIFPCGFGSSGSLALATTPGRDDRMILAEQDCLNVRSVFSLPFSKLILLGMSASHNENSSEDGIGGIKLLRQKSSSNRIMKWDELEEWTDPRDETMGSIASSSILLDACEMGSDGTFAMFLESTEKENLSWRIAILRWNEDMVRCDFLDEFYVSDSLSGERLLASTPILTYRAGSEERYGTACQWSSGRSNLVFFTRTGLKCMIDIPDKDGSDVEMPGFHGGEDEEKQKINDFYDCVDIVCLDLFRASTDLMSACAVAGQQTSAESKAPVGHSSFGTLVGMEASPVHPAFDEEDIDLYGLTTVNIISSDGGKPTSQSHPRTTDSIAPMQTYLAIFRQSGAMELYVVEETPGRLSRCWVCFGSERGLSLLLPSDDASPFPPPRSHTVKIDEARFFFCGPSSSQPEQSNSSYLRSLCLALSTSNGDFFLYTVKRQPVGQRRLTFEREQLKTVCRRTQEQTRHRTKLMKKGIIPHDEASSNHYSCTTLFRFNDISGQDGLFAALPQPKWIVSERGKAVILNHRTRQAAPAGGKLAPVSGFCAPLPVGGFLTLHERVGRFGSQRLTMYRGIANTAARTTGSNISQARAAMIPGGGLYVERIAIGVTVREIKLIEGDGLSTGDHPLYVILVSRELEVDQSAQNDDGMTQEEREQAEREKEEARIQRQVEADLGGFDVEQEWVDEIVRDDVFHVDTDLGGAPPVQREFYSLWIVDAADEWRVVDSYDLEEFEHGLTLQVISLTDFKEEPGSAASTIDLEDMSTSAFVVLGTGSVNHNGEDVSSKGRILLFEVRKPEPGRRLTSQVASLSLAYEKDIFHGPVTSLSCLSTDGRNRLVIGAGADVNLEQWGNGKLTQVGFFRATMQIQNIMLFKNFFLLSDAYDSLYFLVWRESDKSLTLLSKVYDSIAVYAAGVMSRGAAMTFLCHDDRQNVQFFQYAPGEAAARGGNKLVCRADFHLESQTTAFRQHYCRSSLMVHSATAASTLAALKQQDAYHGRTDDDQRLGIHFGTTDAQIVGIVPLSEPVYWRLTALQSVLANALESDCALSPRAWRLYRRSPRRGGCRSNDRKKGVIDGDLIVRYVDLPLTDQEDLASAIGSTVDLILDNLQEIECGNLML